MRDWLDCWTCAFLSNYRWFRKLRGGHWEKWWIDMPVFSDTWLHTPYCFADTDKRPDFLCRGRPTCETWVQS